MINNPNITNVLNPKSLEKQIKIYDTRLQVLQAEVEELTRLKSACSLLLGAQPGAEPTLEAKPAEGAEAKPAKAKGAKKEAKAEEGEATETPAVDPAVADFESDQPPTLEN